MKKKTAMLILIIVIIIGGFFLYKYIKNNFVETVQDEYSNYTPQQEISDEQSRQTKVNVFFKNKETGKVEPEVQSIDAKLLLDNPYIELLNLMNQVPNSEKLEKLIPEETTINCVKKEKDVLIIDFSEQFLNCGDEENKDKILESITKTLTQLTEINSVKILINGEEK